MSQEPKPNVEVLHEGRFLVLLKDGRWEYVKRRNSSGSAVFVVAVTPEREIVLIEQYRVPVQRRCIELPAGIMGDEAHFADESAGASALRELEEETGFRGGRTELILSAPTAPGMTSELIHMVLVTELTRVHAGGGVDGEDITVRLVPLARCGAWLREQLAAGATVDSRIHAALFLLHERGLV